MSKKDEDSINEIMPMPTNEEIKDLALPEAGWRKRLTVNQETGKINLNHVDAIEAWKDFTAEETKKNLLTGKLIGNRNAGVAKMELFRRYIESDSRTEEDFMMIAFEMNFNEDTAGRYWMEYQVLFGKKFRQFLIDAKFAHKNNGKKKNDILEF